MRIRKFRKEDASIVSDLIKNAWIFNNSSYYSPETIRDEIEKNTPESLLERSKTVNYFVATEKNDILGIGGYNQTKLQTFFVDPKHQKKGIGKKIMLRVLSEAEKDGLKQLECWSTFYAEKFYASFGFKRIKEFVYQGTFSSTTFVLMRKKII